MAAGSAGCMEISAGYLRAQAFRTLGTNLISLRVVLFIFVLA